MFRKYITTAFLIFFLSFEVLAQNVIGVVEYLQVKDEQKFLKTEKEWHKIYRELMNTDEMVGCSVYEVLYQKEDYNYIKIKWYDAFSKIDLKITYRHFQEAYPFQDKNDWEVLQQREKEAYDIVSSGVFQQQLSCSNGLDKSGLYYRINEIQVNPGKSKEFRRMIEEIYLPIYQHDVRKNNRTVWSVWAKWTGRTDSFQFTTADGYQDMDQIDDRSFIENFKEVHPELNIEETTKKYMSLYILAKSEMWKMIYRVVR
jgi:hypothetical protein